MVEIAFIYNMSYMARREATAETMFVLGDRVEAGVKSWVHLFFQVLGI